MTHFDRDKLINSFSELGNAMISFGKDAPQQDVNPFLADPYYEKLNAIILREKHHNGWFTEEYVRESLLNLGLLLTKDKLNEFILHLIIQKKLV
jgi:hypothetical protein